MTESKTFVGIDLAGDTGRTGVAIITQKVNGLRYHIPRESWKGSAGIQRMSALIRQANQTAVDQPFSYSMATMKLLQSEQNASGDCAVADYATRRTDRRMREILKDLGLRPEYVMSPNRCHNVWRALALSRQSGLSRIEVCRCQSKIIETHPRVAWAITLSGYDRNELARFVSGYKGINNQDDEMVVRREMLAIFTQETGIQLQNDQDRQSAIDSADDFEALICAYVALCHTLSKTIRSGFEEGERDELDYEGSAVLPASPWIVEGRSDSNDK
ncbi:DUF429 domain-containing protein [Gimesia maris]|uniref:DUF429 domain-containing protein n=1 Tax=Gimesia maris TaxID=122 RepID=UPI0030DD35E3|tara:strand:- start:173975 stop:174793 length:819 start_codon:yes stop_codon:yes gene_type:complete